MGMGRRGVSYLDDGKVEIAWPLVCRSLGSMWLVRGGSEGDGRAVC